MRRRFGWLATAAAILHLMPLHTSRADGFYPVKSVNVTYPDGAGGAFWPEANLIQGPDIGFDSNDPYDKLVGGDAGNWVTDACGFPCSYIDVFGSPIINLDLGQNRRLDEISIWGYTTANANGLKDFGLRFATDAEGPAGYGTSITYNPTFVELEHDELIRQSFSFAQEVNARYVELTALANHFIEPGDGSGGEIPGGDRV